MPNTEKELYFAEIMCSIINPLENHRKSYEIMGCLGSCSTNSLGAATGTRYSLGGLIWDLPKGQKMEDFLLLWIGPDNSAFANVVLTFNGCEIVRHDATEDHLVTDVSQQKRILKRRYYLEKRVRDANMVGILVGTLGVAGYLHVIHQMKKLIMVAGKKAYTLVMGRPNPAKRSVLGREGMGLFLQLRCFAFGSFNVGLAWRDQFPICPFIYSHPILFAPGFCLLLCIFIINLSVV